jgi:hypothetical protein
MSRTKKQVQRFLILYAFEIPIADQHYCLRIYLILDPYYPVVTFLLSAPPGFLAANQIRVDCTSQAAVTATWNPSKIP